MFQVGIKPTTLWLHPRGPLTYFNDGEGGGASDYFWSEIFTEYDLFGSMKNARIFLGHEKKNRGIFGGLPKKDQGNFLGMLNIVGIFLGRQILKL